MKRLKYLAVLPILFTLGKCVRVDVKSEFVEIADKEALRNWSASIIRPVDTDSGIVMQTEMIGAAASGIVHDGQLAQEISYEDIPNVHEKDGFAIGPVNWKMPHAPIVGWSTRNLSESELREMMYRNGYRNLTGLSKEQLRQVMIAYEYEPFFWNIHWRTGWPVSFVFSYFVIENTKHGIESELFRDHLNSGGVKYRGVGQPVEYFDDCTDANGNRIRCEFESVGSFEESEDLWVKVLNNARYDKCRDKRYNTPEKLCYCMYKQGYHTGNSWRLRARVARRFWRYRSRFPEPKDPGLICGPEFVAMNTNQN